MKLNEMRKISTKTTFSALGSDAAAQQKEIYFGLRATSRCHGSD